jgi:hypothetical protein
MKFKLSSSISAFTFQVISGHGIGRRLDLLTK